MTLDKTARRLLSRLPADARLPAANAAKRIAIKAGATAITAAHVLAATARLPWTAHATAARDAMADRDAGRAGELQVWAERLARQRGAQRVGVDDWKAARLVAGDEFMPEGGDAE